ncbi:caspase family protein [Clostridium perfringens]|uniref:caspase family protein n=1 Tax=Clostridium perfringens TaxID=1502 RepID=UPI003BAD09A6
MKKALIIGIDNYPNARLTGCVNDANAVGELLKKNGDGSLNFDVSLNLNVETKAECLELIECLFSGDADVALLYFSGHGSKYGHLITPDYKGKDLGVHMSEILSYANKSKCKNKVIILDCCYSGKFGESIITQGNESILGEGVTIMTASSREEVSEEKDGHGLFTSLFLQGLRGGAADIMGKITPAGIYSFIDQSLGAWQQRPIFKTNISKFVSIRDIEPRVSKKTLRKLGKYFKCESDEFELNPSFEFTNSIEYKHEVVQPYAKKENVSIFKELQLFESVGLVEPVGEEHMYFAAMNSKSCKLTSLGVHYWKLSKDSRF